MFRLFLAVVRRDLKLALRQKSDVLNTVFFFIVVVTLVPLGIGPDQQLLRMIGCCTLSRAAFAPASFCQ